MHRNQMMTLLRVALVATVSVSPAFAQGGGPAIASVELMGSWASANDEEVLIRTDPGPELGNFTGFPINAAGRQKALAWNSTIQALPEYQVRPHPGTYSLRGPSVTIHIAEVVDPGTRRLLAYTITGLFESANRTVWLDGRPHPSEYAEHLWTGFSTGAWENGMLHVTTTHVKQMLIQRNGLSVSPFAVMHEYFIRHGDRLLVVSQVDDPIFLEEPFVRTNTYRWNPAAREGGLNALESADEVPGLKQGDVPHYPLGTRHPEYANENGIPYEATLGGKETLYPEYVEKLKQMIKSNPAGGSK